MYKTSRWLRRREQQLRLHPLCRLCLELRAITTPATVADHIVPHRGDPVLFEGELQSLCASCHSSWKQEMETTGTFTGFDLQGNPLDPASPWRRDLGGEA